MNAIGNPYTRGQGGAALVVSLLMLTVMTFIGVTGMQSTALEERMAGNMRDHALAFEAAESAQEAAEARLNPDTVPDNELPSFSLDGEGGFYMYDKTHSTTPPSWKTVWNDASKVSGYENGRYLAKVHSPPAFFVEEIARPKATQPAGASLEGGVPVTSGTKRTWYRITARGTGGSDNAVAITQSVYLR